MNKRSTKFLITTALCIALSIILKTLGISLTGGGIVIMKINFSAIFYILPGLLFGPFYGAIAGGASDILGFLMKPTGAYMPVFTLTNIIAGFLPALFWKNIKLKSISILKKIYVIFFSIIFISGTVNYILIKFLYNLPIARVLTSLGKKSQYTGIGFILIALLGMTVFMLNEIIEKKSKKNYYLCNNFFKLIMSIGISGIIVSTLNTIFMLVFTPALVASGFMVLWLPRIVQTIIMTMLNAYLLSMLMYLYNFADKKALGVN